MSDACDPRAPASRGHPSGWSWLALALALTVWGGLLYQPLRAAPFEAIDFSDIIPRLEGRRWLAGFASLNAYLAEAGRLNPVTVATLAWRWELFGWNTVAWQLTTLALLVLDAVLVAVLALRLGAGLPGAVAATALMVVGHAPAQTALRVHLGEPVALLLLLCAALVATSARAHPVGHGRTVAVAALCALAILAKETLVAGLPFVLALLVWARPGQMALARPDRADWLRMGAVVAVVMLAAIVPVLWVRAQAPPDAYGARYSISTLSPAAVGRASAAFLLPFGPSPLHPANVALWSMLAGALAATGGGLPPRRRRLAAIGICLLLPLAGAAIYAPWPRMSDYYAYPFVAGLALALALAVTWLLAIPARAARPLAALGVAVMIAFGSKHAAWRAESFLADRELGHALTELVLGSRRDTVLVAVPEPDGYRATILRAWAATLAPDATRVFHEVSCADAAGRLESATALVVTYRADCPRLADATAPHASIARGVSFLASTWRPMRDTLRADAW